MFCYGRYGIGQAIIFLPCGFYLSSSSDMAIFRFLKIVAADILDFYNFEILTVGRVKRVKMRHRPNVVAIGQTFF